MTENQLFFTVFEFVRSKEDFMVRGVFSIESDAKTFADFIASEDCKAPPIVKCTQEDIAEHLVKERLGKIYNLLDEKLRINKI